MPEIEIQGYTEVWLCLIQSRGHRDDPHNSIPCGGDGTLISSVT